MKLQAKGLAALDSEIAQARDQQDRLGREVQIANAKSEVAGHYRVRFMDLRDKLREQVKAANDPSSESAGLKR